MSVDDLGLPLRWAVLRSYNMITFKVGIFLLFFLRAGLELVFASTAWADIVCLVAVTCHVTVALTAVTAHDWRDVGPDLEREPSSLDLV